MLEISLCLISSDVVDWQNKKRSVFNVALTNRKLFNGLERCNGHEDRDRIPPTPAPPSPQKKNTHKPRKIEHFIIVSC